MIVYAIVQISLLILPLIWSSYVYFANLILVSLFETVFKRYFTYVLEYHHHIDLATFYIS